MKTLIIYNDGMSIPQYVVVDGDYSRFNGVCVNAVRGTGAEDEFVNWFFNQDSGEFLFELSEDTALIENKDWDKVAVCTFLP